MSITDAEIPPLYSKLREEHALLMLRFGDERSMAFRLRRALWAFVEATEVPETCRHGDKFGTCGDCEINREHGIQHARSAALVALADALTASVAAMHRETEVKP